jgi:long-chain acyl-CoA synthetase
MNVANLLCRSAAFFPERPAVCEKDSETSYAKVHESSNRVADGLRVLGVQPGDYVGICAPNSTDWLTVYFGILKIGAVAVTFSYGLQPEELGLLVTHANPRIVFTDESRAHHFEELKKHSGIEIVISDRAEYSLAALLKNGRPDFAIVDRDRTDTAAVLYTGGTSGTPKGVCLSHENILTSAHNVAYSERSKETDRSLCFLPLNHVFGQIHIMNATIFSSGCVELLTSYDMDRVLGLASAGRITKLYAVPTIYSRLLTVNGLGEKLGRIQYCFSAAASMASEIVRQWKEHTGLTIYEGYGMTESASAVTYNHFYEHVVGSVGTSVPGIEVEIRNGDGVPVGLNSEGEICIRGRNIMNGYLHNPADTRKAFREGGWFRSGDVGVMDDRGYVYIVDRLKDMIITGGENVYPREVEEIIFTIPDVQECAVVGLPDREWGERVVAFVIPKSGKSLQAADLKTFLKQRLSAFKIPKEFIMVDELPKNSTGKILKREIRKQFNKTVQK